MDKVDVWEAYNITLEVATFFTKTNRYHAAIEFYKELLTLLKVIENLTSSRYDRQNMTIYISLAYAYLRIGNYDESKANAKLALQISNKIGDKNGELTCYDILCEVTLALGRQDKAIKYFEKRLQISRETGDAENEAEMYDSLGLLHLSLCQTEKAMAYQLKSLKLSKEIGNRKLEVRTLTHLGNLYLVLGKESQAVQKLEEALKINEEIGDDCSGASIVLLLGRAYLSIGQYDKSIEYQSSRRVSKMIQDNENENEGRACCGIGACLFFVKKYDEAIVYLEKALEIGKSTGDRITMEEACNTLVRIHLALGQQEKATEYKEQAMKSIAEDEGRPAGTRSMALACLSLGYVEEGNMQQTCDILSESIRCYEIERESLNNEHKVSLADVQHEAYKTHCHYLIALGKVRDALCTAERGRARVLGELLSKKYAIQETRLELVNQDSLSSLIGSLTTDQLLVFMAVICDVIQFWLMTNEEELTIRARKESLESSKSSVHDMLGYILQKNFRSLAHGRDIECEDRSLSAFYDSESTADDENDKRNNGKRPVELDDEDSDGEKNAINASHQLYNMLISPFADRIEGREVVLVPEGSMFMVPFSALQNDSGKFLSETCRIRIIPSLTTLKLIQDCPADYHNTTGALIVGDPDVGRVTTRLRQLPAARQEAKEIADLLNVPPLLGEQATKEEVLRRITDVCLIHIAAHGDAERGEIFCTPSPSSPQVPRKEDFMLTMEDIAKVRIRAKLVVLSCCHSGRGKIMKAEGVVGIARAFIASGARSVLVSLWLLNDKSTKDFMIRFYGHLVRDKLSASEALHQSIKWMRESKKYIVSDWAPFVLIGDDVTLDL